MTDLPPLPPRIFDAHNHANTENIGELLEKMDACNVERALIMGTSRTPNDEIINCVRQHGDRLIGGAYCDPRNPARAIEELNRCAGEGIRLVKLFPNFGYFPDDEALWPFFEAVAEKKLAVLSHCGWLTPKSGVTAAYYSHPGRFEKVIRRHSETIFIMAHMGGIAGFLEAIMLTTRTPNTYVDCSPGQGMWVLENCGPMAATHPPERLMWGADSLSHAELIDRCHKALVKMGWAEHLEKVFYSNARTLFERIGAIPPETATQA